jgi:hypothetical protein
MPANGAEVGRHVPTLAYKLLRAKVNARVRARRREYARNYRKRPGSAMAARLRNRLGNLLRHRAKSQSCRELVGCTWEELKLHVERQFAPGMTWEHTGRWHLDHRKPLSLFDLDDPEECRAACHFSNLRPLWATDNQRKHAKDIDLPDAALAQALCPNPS